MFVKYLFHTHQMLSFQPLTIIFDYLGDISMNYVVLSDPRCLRSGPSLSTSLIAQLI